MRRLLDALTRIGCLLAGHQWDVTDRTNLGPETLEHRRCRHCGSRTIGYRRRPW